MRHLKNWLLVNLGIALMLLTTAFIMSANRGAGLYYQEFKEFRSAVSRASGGDWEQTRQQFIEPPINETQKPEQPAPYDVSQLTNQEANELLEALFARTDINDAALETKKKKKG